MSRVSIAEFLDCPSRRSSISRGATRCVLLTAMFVACISFHVPFSRAQQSSQPTEYQVKAAYLYNFGKFVDWSAANEAAKRESFQICVLGQDPFGPSLDAAFAKQSIDGKSVMARRLTKPQDALGCRVLFISSSEDRQLKGIFTVLNGAGVLTVSDSPQFSQRGGMIEFTLEGNKVRFEVNLTSAEAAGLSLSSELLKVAVAVRRSTSSGD
jgi:hypothetical protein